MAVQKGNLDEVFKHHPPENEDQERSYARIRESGKLLVNAILEETVVCGDQQAAIRKVREAVMTANAAIALKGLV